MERGGENQGDTGSMARVNDSFEGDACFAAHRQGEYRLALREFRTVHRMNDYLDYLPFMADCERGLRHPRKAIDIVCSDVGRVLDGELKAEIFLVYAGAAQRVPDGVVQASSTSSRAPDATLDELEPQYADEEEYETSPEEVVIDYDLEDLVPFMNSICDGSAYHAPGSLGKSLGE